MKKVKLYFGALNSSVSMQIEEQTGIKVSLPQYDKDADALVRLYIRGIILDSKKHKADKRLVRKIIQYFKTHPLRGLK